MSNKLRKDKTSHHFRKWLKASGLPFFADRHRAAHGCFGCYVTEMDWTRDIEPGAHGESENRASRRWHGKVRR